MGGRIAPITGGFESKRSRARMILHQWRKSCGGATPGCCKNAKSKVQSPKSKVRRSKFQVPSSKFQVPSQKPKIRSPQVGFQQPERAIRNPKSPILNPLGGWRAGGGGVAEVGR